jgi:hypothetical protein
MAGTLADAVFDAALNYIKANVTKIQLRDASSAVLLENASLTSANFGAAGDNSGAGGGRKIEALASGLDAQAVSSGGSATKGVLLASSTVVATVDITSAPKQLDSSGTADLAAFSIILKDPA